LRRDAKLRMLSCARQQAVMIAMEFTICEVSETNYRCSVLGMHLFIRENLNNTPLLPRKVPTFLSRRMTAWRVTKTPPSPLPPPPPVPVPGPSVLLPGPNSSSIADSATITTTAASTVWTTSDERCMVPKEAVALHLLSLGYTTRDLSHPSLAELLDVDHLEGFMPLESIGLSTAAVVARGEIAKKGTYFEAFKRFQRKLKVFAKYQLELKRVTRALTQYPEVVDKKGGEFLKEILTGVSHCLE
jgi:hypothetical protein